MSHANASAAQRRDACPPWCVQDHGVQSGEEDWLHLSAPLPVADCGEVRLCMSRNPETGEQDGPVVVIGTTEYPLDAAAALGMAIVDIARLGLATAS
jgi:hypothetical protein